jgi:transposase-like protein
LRSLDYCHSSLCIACYLLEIEKGGADMRMDENSNPEWKQMLGGISSGRKALEIISNLEAQLAECQQERDALREAALELVNARIVRDTSKLRKALAATKENDGE